ncbi:MAG: glycosyl hydrolase family protein [Saprospiraceae bacterium]|nr:MAG: glycosyl hydrolase family protein [Saprospiraceae bacterium]
MEMKINPPLILGVLAITLLNTSFATSCKEGKSESPTAQFSSLDYSFPEDGDVSVEVALEFPATSSITFRYATADGTAVAGQDYETQNGEINFAAGESVKSISIAVTRDTTLEPDEYFYVKLSTAANEAIATARVSLLNDDTHISLPAEGYTTPSSYPGYDLLWSDEFEGSSIDNGNWTYDLGDGCPDVCGWGNNELEWYTDRPENAYVQDGSLIINAMKENIGGKSYSSARLKSQGKQNFKYGRIDVRAVLPYGKGLWPAIWMLGKNITSVGWPACGEIDIMEIFGGPGTDNKVLGTAHWDNANSHASYGGSVEVTSSNLKDAWHVFSITWDETFIRWYVDDVQYQVIDITPAGLSEFHEEFFFLLNVAVGGNAPGAPDATTQFPQFMAVDYVRVFKKQ